MGSRNPFRCNDHDAHSYFGRRLDTRQTPVSRIGGPTLAKARTPPSQHPRLTGCHSMDPSDRGEVASSTVDLPADADLLREILRMAARRTRSACHGHSGKFPVRRVGRGGGSGRIAIASGLPRQPIAAAGHEATQVRRPPWLCQTSSGRLSEDIRRNCKGPFMAALRQMLMSGARPSSAYPIGDRFLPRRTFFFIGLPRHALPHCSRGAHCLRAS